MARRVWDSVVCGRLFYMNTTEIIVQIDSQIIALQHAKSILLGSEPAKKLGRPKKLHVAHTIAASPPIASPERKMSASGKARIAAAQKARWAKLKKANKKAKPVQA